MKRQCCALPLLSLLVTPFVAAAYESIPVNTHEQLCYGRAMIGFDSVINSRLGVPAEHALHLAVLRHAAPTQEGTVYSKALLNTIWDAYFWQETPHSYALKVFYRCATEQTTLRSARNDWLISEDSPGP